MVEFKHGKYIVTEGRQNIPKPPWGGYLSPENTSHVMYLDDSVIKGAFFMECVWFWPTENVDTISPNPHKHDYEEIFLFLGTDPKDTAKLGAVIEFWLGEGDDLEKVVINTSSAVYVPAGLAHFPQIWKNVQRPVMTMMIMPTTGERNLQPVPIEGRTK